MELTKSRFKKKVYLESLGCAKNLVDSEVIQGSLLQSGYELTARKEDAVIILVNTCAFIEEATRESITTILELSKQKKVGSCRSLVVCGCLPQRYKEELVKELPEVDLFLGTGEFQHITKHLKRLHQSTNGSRLFAKRPTFLLSSHTPRMLATPGYSAYLKIAEGCSHRCTYCIIPKIKGPYKSRSPRSILAEVKRLTEDGVREFNLISQDTTQYGINRHGKEGLTVLLKKMVKIPSIKWIRLLYCHPLNLNRDLIDIIAEQEKICNYLDLPLQHISDAILKRMGRNITRKKIEKLLTTLKNKAPQIALRTTFMVGFPGETEKDFKALLSFVSDTGFDHLGIFRYRDEEGTAAFKLGPKVPEKIKEERYHLLMSLQAKISGKKQRKRLGKSIEVLIEGLSCSRSCALQGRAAFQAPEVDGLVYIKQGKAPPGTFRTVRIIKVLTYDLIGELV